MEERRMTVRKTKITAEKKVGDEQINHEKKEKGNLRI